MNRSDTAALQAAHYADAHGCCWAFGDPLYVMCGLWCGHQGEHVPYVPGGYLRLPPEMHPLEVLLFRIVRRPTAWPWLWWGPSCPVCRRPVVDWDCWWPQREGWQAGDEWRIGLVATWRLRPCGCEARELAGIPVGQGDNQC